MHRPESGDGPSSPRAGGSEMRRRELVQSEARFGRAQHRQSHAVVIVLKPYSPGQQAARPVVAPGAELRRGALDHETRIRGGVARRSREQQLCRMPGASRLPQRLRAHRDDFAVARWKWWCLGRDDRCCCSREEQRR